MMSFAKWYKKVYVAFAALASASLAIMIISTTSDTTLRYAINFPIPGVFELMILHSLRNCSYDVSLKGLSFISLSPLQNGKRTSSASPPKVVSGSDP